MTFLGYCSYNNNSSAKPAGKSRVLGESRMHATTNFTPMLTTVRGYGCYDNNSSAKPGKRSVLGESRMHATTNFTPMLTTVSRQRHTNFKPLTQKTTNTAAKSNNEQYRQPILSVRSPQLSLREDSFSPSADVFLSINNNLRHHHHRKKVANPHQPQVVPRSSAIPQSGTRGKRSFDERFKDLMTYRDEFGNCNVSRNPQDKRYKSLGSWCGHIRHSYQRIQKGLIPSIKLTDENIQRLNDVDFKWNLLSENIKSFDDHCETLIEFKTRFGHCDVPSRLLCAEEYKSLGSWCTHMRHSYKCFQTGKYSSYAYKLTNEKIQRLEGIGLKLSKCDNARRTFDDHFDDLLKFRAKFGHCNVPSISKHKSLYQWTITMQYSYQCIKRGKVPQRKLSQKNIQRLEGIGFVWNGRL